MNNNKKTSEEDVEDVVETLTLAYTESPRSECRLTSSDLSSGTSSSESSTESSETQDSIMGLLAELEQANNKEKNFGYFPVRRIMSLNDGPKLVALEYLWTNSVYKLFTFMMSHLLAHTPDHPIPFLISVLDRCIRYRDEGQNPPLLFEERHINSVYTALDPMDEGTITYSQYLVGMETLGVNDFNILPEELEGNKKSVPKDVFLSEAKHALLTQFKNMLGMGQEGEENGIVDKNEDDHVQQPSMRGSSDRNGEEKLDGIHDAIETSTRHSKSSVGGGEIYEEVETTTSNLKKFDKIETATSSSKSTGEMEPVTSNVTSIERKGEINDDTDTDTSLSKSIGRKEEIHDEIETDTSHSKSIERKEEIHDEIETDKRHSEIIGRERELYGEVKSHSKTGDEEQVKNIDGEVDVASTGKRKSIE